MTKSKAKTTEATPTTPPVVTKEETETTGPASNSTKDTHIFELSIPEHIFLIKLLDEFQTDTNRYGGLAIDVIRTRLEIELKLAQGLYTRLQEELNQC